MTRHFGRGGTINPGFALIALFAVILLLWCLKGTLSDLHTNSSALHRDMPIYVFGAMWTVIWAVLAIQYPLKKRNRS